MSLFYCLVRKSDAQGQIRDGACVGPLNDEQLRRVTGQIKERGGFCEVLQLIGTVGTVPGASHEPPAS